MLRVAPATKGCKSARPCAGARCALESLARRCPPSAGYHFVRPQRLAARLSRRERRAQLGSGLPGARGRGRAVAVRAAGEEEQELDYAVFRFTLGIPGLDEAQLPRVVGVLLGMALVANHLLSQSPLPLPQARAEVLGAALVGTCCLLPWVGQELREGSKRGVRGGGGGQRPFGTNLFRLAPELEQAQQRELAWTSYALLRNTNARALLLVREGRPLMLRGELAVPAQELAGAEPEQQWRTLCQSAAATTTATPRAQAAGAEGEQVLYVKEGAATSAGVAGRVPFVPAATASALVVPLECKQEEQQDAHAHGGSFLALLSPERRAFSTSEVAWAQSCALKLQAALE